MTDLGADKGIASDTVIPRPSSSARQEPGRASELVAELARRLQQAGVRHAHWKGNYTLDRVHAAEEDLDLLVDRRDLGSARAALSELGFLPAETFTSRQTPGVEHHIHHDLEAARLVNVHLYSRLLTGDHLLKCSAWPLEQALLESAQPGPGLPTVSRSAELVVFVLRNLVKDLSWLDRYFRRRAGAGSGAELDWLLKEADLDVSRGLLEQHLPQVPWTLFQEGLTALQTGAPRRRRRLGRRLRKHLAQYERYGPWERRGRALLMTARMTWNKFGRGLKPMTLSGGGLLVAIVGDQATGKSTTIEHLRDWLAQELAVERAHVGKPPASPLTWLPMKGIPLLRRLLPNRRTGAIEQRLEAQSHARPPLSFVVRRLMMAWDRRRLLRRLHRASHAGRIVLCDRYPADNPGAIDSRSFRPEQIEREPSALRRALMRWEGRIYDSVPPADLVLRLTVSVEVAVQRNVERIKAGPEQTEDYVRFRHAMRTRPEFSRSKVRELDTDQPLEATLRAARQAVWDAL